MQEEEDTGQQGYMNHLSISLPPEGIGRAEVAWRVRSQGEGSRGPETGKVGSMQRGEGRYHSQGSVLTLAGSWEPQCAPGPGSLGAHHNSISEGHNVDRPHGAEAGQDGKDDVVPRFLGAITPFNPGPCQLGAGMAAEATSGRSWMSTVRLSYSVLLNQLLQHPGGSPIGWGCFS